MRCKNCDMDIELVDANGKLEFYHKDSNGSHYRYCDSSKATVAEPPYDTTFLTKAYVSPTSTGFVWNVKYIADGHFDEIEFPIPKLEPAALPVPLLTEDDRRDYIDYCKKLYDMVVSSFYPKLSIDSKDASHDLQKYGEAIGNAIGLQTIIVDIYLQIRPEFQEWLKRGMKNE